MINYYTFVEVNIKTPPYAHSTKQSPGCNPQDRGASR
jgi:hypothetical protein